MTVHWDPDVDVTDIELTPGPAVTSEYVGCLMSVDLDEEGHPVRISVATPRADVTAGDWEDLVDAYPEIKKTFPSARTFVRRVQGR